MSQTPENTYSHSAWTSDNRGEPTPHDRYLTNKFAARALHLSDDYGWESEERQREFVVSLIESVTAATNVGRDQRYAFYERNMMFLRRMYDDAGLDEGDVNHHMANISAEGDMNAHLQHFYDLVMDHVTDPAVPDKDLRKLVGPKDDDAISIELGHSDQYGIWEEAYPLNEALERLVTVKHVGDTGLRLAYLYEKNHPRTSYSFTFSPPTHGSRLIGSAPLVHGVRKRPVVDLVSDKFPELPVGIWKYTAVEIAPQLLGRERAATIFAAINKPDDRGANSEAGMVIEDAVLAGQREEQLAVSAVSALVLARMQLQGAA